MTWGPDIGYGPGESPDDQFVSIPVSEFEALTGALSRVRGQLSLGPDGDEARRIIDAALHRKAANSQAGSET